MSERYLSQSDLNKCDQLTGDPFNSEKGLVRVKINYLEL